MPLNFPDSPVPGQIFQSYVWDGEKWLGASSAAASSVVGAVRYDAVQALTAPQQTQGRANINAVNKAGDTMTGALIVNGGNINGALNINATGSVTAGAAVYTGYATTTSGTYYFGNSVAKYLTCDGANYGFAPGNVGISGQLNINGNTSVTGQLTVNGPSITVGDTTSYRLGAPTTGYHFFGNASKYFGYDGAAFNMVGANLYLSNTTATAALWFCNTGQIPVSGVAGSGTSINVYSNSGGSTGLYIALNTSAWTAISDARLPYKKTARPLAALDRLADVQLYENEVDGRLELFAKAQEIHKAFPHVVKQGSGDNDYVPTGMSDEKAWGVSYDRMGIIALQAVKELLAEVETLKARVKELEK